MIFLCCCLDQTTCVSGFDKDSGPNVGELPQDWKHFDEWRSQKVKKVNGVKA